jgi:hypothetical protein
VDDFRSPIDEQARFALPYLKIAVVAVLAAGVLGVGFFGPHPGGAGATPTPLPIAAATTPPPAPPNPDSSASALASVAGLTRFDPAPGQVGVSWLPGSISSGSMALIGRRLFFIVDGDRIESTEVGSNGAEQPIVTVPQCEGINQLAAAGSELAYLVTSPSGPTAEVADCGATGTVSWSVWLLNLAGGAPRQVASGLRAATTIDIAEFPVHLALGDSAYAFNRPPDAASTGAGTGDVVEVHALDGTLLWSSIASAPVAGVMLGGRTLAVLTQARSGGGKSFDLWISTAARPRFSPVDKLIGSASLSPDGLQLAWGFGSSGLIPEPNPGQDVAIETLAQGPVVSLNTPTDSASPAPLEPQIWSLGGRLAVTWFATSPGGAVYPAIRYATGGSGVFLPSLQEPIWMDVQGGTLVWVAEGAGGWSKVAFEVDLNALGLK